MQTDWYTGKTGSPFICNNLVLCCTYKDVIIISLSGVADRKTDYGSVVRGSTGRCRFKVR